jgi:hypothetical protein
MALETRGGYMRQGVIYYNREKFFIAEKPNVV